MCIGSLSLHSKVIGLSGSLRSDVTSPSPPSGQMVSLAFNAVEDSSLEASVKLVKTGLQSQQMKGLNAIGLCYSWSLEARKAFKRKRLKISLDESWSEQDEQERFVQKY